MTRYAVSAVEVGWIVYNLRNVAENIGPLLQGHVQHQRLIMARKNLRCKYILQRVLVAACISEYLDRTGKIGFTKARANDSEDDDEGRF